MALDFASFTSESVVSFKLLFSLGVHGMVTTFFSTVTSCFIRPTLLSEKLINCFRSSLYLELKSVQLDTGPTVVVADCLFILALTDDGLVDEENWLVGVPDDVEADADVEDVVLKEA